jgi:hypothetical protein
MLRTPPVLNGLEIDLEPDDPTLPNTHSAVRERRLVGGVSFAAVYPNLKAGSYTVLGSGQRIVIVGGRVTEVDFEVSARAKNIHTHGSTTHTHESH